MKILTVIFDKKDQSNERYYLNYCQSLKDGECNVYSLTYKNDPIIKSLPQGVENVTINNFGQWDPVVGWKIKKIIENIKPDLILVHGMRALSIFRKITIAEPIIAVCHTSKIANFEDYSHILVSNNSLKKLLLKNGHEKDVIQVVPDFINAHPINFSNNFEWKNKPPIIGSFGKFTSRKGFRTLLKSFSILRSRGVAFRAIISGKGLEYEKLKIMAHDLLIEEIVTFYNWVENKDAFFKSIDIFCLPSLESNSSLSLLETFSYGMPTVATMTEGNLEVANSDRNCILVPAGEADSMAFALERLIKNPSLTEKISKKSHETIINNYNQECHRKSLITALENIINQQYRI